MNLSPAQRRAAEQIADPQRTTGGVLYAGNGVRRDTAARLVEAGLAEWAPAPHVTSHRRPMGSRTHYQTEWGIRPTADQFLKTVVARYYRSGFERSLTEYLGMTETEYCDWFTTGIVPARVRRTWGLA